MPEFSQRFAAANIRNDRAAFTVLAVAWTILLSLAFTALGVAWLMFISLCLHEGPW